jgi:protein SCO1/2
MNKGVIRTIIICTVFMAAVLGLTAHRILTPTVLTHEQLNDLGLFTYEIPKKLADFSLKRSDGTSLTKIDLRNQWTLLYFGYTYCPDICPITMAVISQFDEELQKVDPALSTVMQVVFISVDPERDSPEQLSKYVQYFGEDYIGATGDFADLFKLARQLNIAFGYIPEGDEGDYLVNHSGELVLINPYGDYAGFFKAPQNPEQMLESFQSLVREWEAKDFAN